MRCLLLRQKADGRRFRGRWTGMQPNGREKPVGAHRLSRRATAGIRAVHRFCLCHGEPALAVLEGALRQLPLPLLHEVPQHRDRHVPVDHLRAPHGLMQKKVAARGPECLSFAAAVHRSVQARGAAAHCKPVSQTASSVQISCEPGDQAVLHVRCTCTGL